MIGTWAIDGALVPRWQETCAPEFTFHEGKAMVYANCLRLGVSARVYYTTGGNDSAVTAISDSKIVHINQGNLGD